MFENFRNKCIEIYELDSANFLSALGFACQACIKKTGRKLELITDVDMLFMVEKRIRGGICHAIHRYAKANNKYVKKNKKQRIINTGVQTFLYRWVMSQKLPVNCFKWKRN